MDGKALPTGSGKYLQSGILGHANTRNTGTVSQSDKSHYLCTRQIKKQYTL